MYIWSFICLKRKYFNSYHLSISQCRSVHYHSVKLFLNTQYWHWKSFWIAIFPKEYPNYIMIISMQDYLYIFDARLWPPYKFLMWDYGHIIFSNVRLWWLTPSKVIFAAMIGHSRGSPQFDSPLGNPSFFYLDSAIFVQSVTSVRVNYCAISLPVYWKLPATISSITFPYISAAGSTRPGCGHWGTLLQHSHYAVNNFTTAKPMNYHGTELQYLATFCNIWNSISSLSLQSWASFQLRMSFFSLSSYHFSSYRVSCYRFSSLRIV